MRRPFVARGNGYDRLLMIPIMIMIRGRKLLHVSRLTALIPVLELLTLRRLARVASIRRFVRACVRDFIGMTRFHHRALVLVIAVERP